MQSEILIEKAEKEMQMTEDEILQAQDEALQEVMEWVDYNQGGVFNCDPQEAAHIVLEFLKIDGVHHWTEKDADIWLMEWMKFQYVGLEEHIQELELDTAHEAKNGNKKQCSK